MRFTPKSEEELRTLLPAGDYQFEVRRAENKTSKKGNDMIELMLLVYGDAGETVPVNDWLVPGTQMGDRKLRHFCHSAGLEELYDNGDLNYQDCIGRSGTVKLRVKKDASGQYPDKNEVADYVVPKSEPAPEPAATNGSKPLGVSPHQARAANKSAPEGDMPF